ncbi:Surfeit locus 6 [Cordyceps fumosorosea ARSEF 2679]|uniref:Surfeit locus 6 n=1 Tax=Cordyceps fumosorosea (strain ARSEF 2679) TaxID=1081104 RepID=A0A162JTN3_CORFA|nr:Surfeit locus 6 [Cordyceps fumosorosea ARSEF 2679]OAA73632.1 Surfeit locus 6 [Cordyceps fumosorosea ARSEF 2679]
MTEASLQDRLRDHAKAFNGLLSLIPAKQYYGEDTSDQWKKKKQTKKEAAAARRGKLDPDSELHKNAKEVMDERARNKRKQREEEEDEGDEEEEGHQEQEDGEADSFLAMEGVEEEQPGQGLRKATEKPNKKQKVEPKQDDDESGIEVDDEPEETAPAAEEQKLSKKEQKKAAKRERKAEKKAAKAQGGASQQHTPNAKSSKDQENETPSAKKQKAKQEAKKEAKKETKAAASPDVEEDEAMPDAQESSGFAANLDVAGLDNKDDFEEVSEPHSPVFDAEPASSTSTSVSSAIPPSEKSKHLVVPKDTSALKARLAARIEALRAARKADGPDGKPIRTRQQLIEARREKQVQRKEHKKELRRAAKLEEERKREEALASNSPGAMSPAAVADDGSFSFGRVAFADGSQMSHDLSYVLNQGKRKGPSDAKTALLRVQNQKKRLAEMDAESRTDVAEKEAWLAARRRAEGEGKIRDDEAALKKTIKRKEAGKRRSEKAWGDRLKGVSQAQHDRVKKREDNLRKRRDEKIMGKAGKKKKGGAAGGGGGKKKGGRPGFEGSFGVAGRKK